MLMKSPTLLGQPLDALPFAFFDVETTGLLPARGHRICEVALLRVCGGLVEQRLETLVDPQSPVEEQAFFVNGITTEMLAGAPRFATVADSILEALDGAVLVAHNAPFDVIFLMHEMQLADKPVPLNPVVDTLLLARRLLRRRSYSLSALAYDLGVPPPSHRAMSDVLALQGLFEHLVQHMELLNLSTLRDVLRYQRGVLPGEPEPTPPPIIEKALREGRRLRIVYCSRTTAVPTERIVQPIELLQERKGVFLRAYCYLRNDLRSFALSRVEEMDLVN